MPDISNNTTSAKDLGLLPHHFDRLHTIYGLSIEVIRERGYRSIEDPAVLAQLGFAKYQCRVPALLIPIHPPKAARPVYQIRPDEPRVLTSKKGKTKVIKYEWPKGERSRLDVPPRAHKFLGDPTFHYG